MYIIVNVVKFCVMRGMKLEELRIELERLIDIKGIEDKDVLELSQKLDLYILQYYCNLHS
jgi:hypothetical protein